MKNYLNSLNERERWMLIGAVIFLLFYGYYILLYAPLSNKLQQEITLFQEKINTLDWMKQIQQKGISTKSKKSVDHNQLLGLIDSELKGNKALHFPYQLQQTASGDIQINFEQVPFNLFIAWLSRLNDEYNINVKQMEIEHSNTPGVTRLLIVMGG